MPPFVSDPIFGRSTRTALLVGAALWIVPAQAYAEAQLENPAEAEYQNQSETSDEDEVYDTDIVVTAPRLQGQLKTDVRALAELDEADISSYGASSIEELLEALEPQTRSGGGSGRPVMLVNGRRISGFNGIRSIPPEAIAKMEIFPEEVALQYGYAATQRVVNFVLKPNFKQFSGEIEGGTPTQGGRLQSELEGNFIAIRENGRLNMKAGWEHKGLLLESERDLTPTNGISASTEARSLLSQSDAYVVEGTVVRNLDRVTDLTLSGSFEQTDSLGLLGLAGDGVSARRRNSRNQNFSTSAAVNGMLGSWTWALTGNYADDDTRTLTDQDAAQRSRVDSSQQTFGANANATGTIVEGWAGPIRASVTAGYAGQRFDSRTEDVTGISSNDLARDTPSILGSVTIPLLDPDYDIGKIGRLSLTLNGNAEKPSDFSGLTSWGSSLNWGVTDRLSFIASYQVDEAAPTMSQLGATQLVTENVTYYDLKQGETVEITSITGGNPDLLAETRRQLKFGMNWQVPFVEGMRFSAEYNRKRSSDTPSSFPLLTEAIEAAFPDRVTRAPDGTLLSFDQRPVNFARSESSQLRWGISMSGKIAANSAATSGRGQNAGAGAATSGGGVAEGARTRGDGVAPPREAGERRMGRGRPVCVTPDQMTSPIVEGQIAGSVAPQRGAPSAEGERPRLTCPDGLSLRFIPNPEAAADGTTPARPMGEGNAVPPMDGRPPMDGPPPERMAGGGSGGRGMGMMGGGPRGPGGMMGGGGGGGRWNVDLNHTIKLTDTVNIGQGVPELDLLNGDATGSGGGSTRHLVELNGGFFYKGIGTRLSAKYDGGSRIVGGANGDLKFHDLATFNLRVFAEFNQMPKVTESLPFLKNSRMRFSFNNIFDAQRKVTDGSGLVPLNYQPGYIDPLGRYVELSWRKSF
ncbi:TonB-dependent receptor plug domain-containing protein [Sphingopyxis yananensis]|uniref:TonB-dependent receptor plug domain-containing protein n=1 Tax=Sphingopyxis yananensis TaxID=2886687 RepID=UPI001D1123EE|nr:ABC transporter ATP-binding protein [Sphingopyxis yananensis]MCC2602626.1 ABC transporter ATP-binding protein [Sphingopyxis yananensis]